MKDVCEHPTYQYPVILEALCELRFELAGESAWKPSFQADLYQKLQNDGFSGLEPVHNTRVELRAEQSELNQVVRAQGLMRFTNSTENWLVQLGEGVLSVNVLPVYPGWTTMRSRTIRAWTYALNVLSPAVVTRIGLRYINGIANSGEPTTPGHWLKASRFIQEEVLASLPGFYSRLQARNTSDSTLVVTLAERQIEGAATQLIFDIDCSREGAIDPAPEAVQNVLEDLHEREWSVFAASMTPRLEALMRGNEE